jgi:hypothetical protein
VIPSADGKDQESTSEELNLLQPGTAHATEKLGKLGTQQVEMHDAWKEYWITFFKFQMSRDCGHSSGFQLEQEIRRI